MNTVPYKLVFGRDAQVGISSLPIAPELIDDLTTEAELDQVLLDMAADGVHGETTLAIGNGPAAANNDNDAPRNNRKSTGVPAIREHLEAVVEEEQIRQHDDVPDEPDALHMVRNRPPIVRRRRHGAQKGAAADPEEEDVVDVGADQSPMVRWGSPD